MMIHRFTMSERTNAFPRGNIVMKQGINAAVAASLLLLSTSAFAADEITRPNYNYAEVDFVYAEIETEVGGEDRNLYFPEGVAARGSYAFDAFKDLDGDLLLRGSYYTGSGEFKNAFDVDWDSWLLSAGWLIPTEDTTGIDISLDYRNDDIDLSSRDADADGFGMSFGVRAAPIENLELGVRLGWYEGDYDGAIGFTVNAAYNFTEQWGVNLFWDQLNNSSDTLNQFGIGGRFYF
jgi:hypothetical protein